MAQRRHHYERAFEEYLRSRRIPYVSVDEAKKALLPVNATFRVSGAGESGGRVSKGAGSLKSFDFVIYGQDGNLLIDIKGRRVSRRGRPAIHDAMGNPRPAPRSSLESWVTLDDIESLKQWQALFGPAFQPAFVFVYWCEEQPPDALFQEIFEYRSRWYALRAVTLDAYERVMKPRSVRWRTVDVPSARFEEVSQPFADAKLASHETRSAADRSGNETGGLGAILDDVSFLPGYSSDRARHCERDFGPDLPALHAHAPALGSKR
ncbi:MAG: HYExAFE family protein [Pyrinomonadaceae bacterium]|nr:HYExAFE family protein [Phycisphaerales bacterium]